MKKTDLAYMAGIFDGEGCITIVKAMRRNRVSPLYTMSASIKMANPYIPRLFQIAFGGSIHKKEANGNRLSQWNWVISTRQAMEFLKVMLPYLKLKADEAKLAIAYQEVKQRPKAIKGKGRGRFGIKSEGELAVEEAQRLLLHNLKNKSGEPSREAINAK